MGKMGPQPKKIINEKWTPNLAYAIGLIATDGCLSNDGLLIDLTSKDREQLLNFSKCVGVDFKIGSKKNGNGNKCLRIQFKNRIFYDFLLSIGLTPRKSLIMGKLKIPKKYFFDFLRGCFDGDGCFYSYWDPRWRSSFMFYLTFTSGSYAHILWLREEIYKRLSIKGHISKSKRKGSIYNLRYAKKEALEVIKKMYYTPRVVCLSRKKLKIEKALETEERQQKNYK
jgi:hypothetical protein